MKTRILVPMVTALLALGVGCKDETLTSSGMPNLPELGSRAPNGALPGAPGGGQVVTAPDYSTPGSVVVPGGEVSQDYIASVRVRGENIGDLTWLGLAVQEFHVYANGVELQTFGDAASVMNLADPTNAWLLGRFVLPPDVNSVNVVVTFDDFGGYESATGNGSVDARVMPLDFTLDRAYLDRNQHGVLHVDLQQSLVSYRDEEKLLLPNVSLIY